MEPNGAPLAYYFATCSMVNSERAIGHRGTNLRVPSPVISAYSLPGFLAARMQHSRVTTGNSTAVGGAHLLCPWNRRLVMICTLSEGNEMRIAAPNGMTEFVRGNDHCLVAQLEPLVRQHSVTLDLKGVDRIDGAGISALISLYGSAHDAGHGFMLCNVPPRVAQILALVGLDAILLPHVPEDCAREACLERSAA